MDESLKAVYERLLKRLDEMPEEAIKRDRTVMLVLLPHHDFRKDFSLRAKEAFLDFGFAVDRTTAQQVSGDEFEMDLYAISPYAGRGKTINVVYMPSPDGLKPNQKKLLEDFKTSMIPCISAGQSNAIFEY
jgi:hypothetical protein